jgi:ribosomal protein L30/L7E
MKLPSDVLSELEKTLEGLRFAKVNLEVVFHDGKPKFRIIIEKSIVPGVDTSGGAPALEAR